MPGCTSAWLFEQVHSHLVCIRDDNSEVFSSNQFAAPASTIQTLVNGTICLHLPSHDCWVKTYENDSELIVICKLIPNPSKICNESLSKVNYNYRGALCKSLLLIEKNMIILREPIVGSDSYTQLQIVPCELYNIIFVALHPNPIGAHLNAYWTLHRIQLHFYWPSTFAYVKRMCNACLGCALSNPNRGKSSELVYGFPIEAPFLVMHFNAYSAGKHSGFKGSEVYLIGCCGMCRFVCMEPVANLSATTFASAIMKIQLRYSFCHTSVLDKDNKVFGVCHEALDLLQINCHILSDGGNHNPMLDERVNRYINKGLKIMTNERRSIQVALEAILLLIYAWNSCPIPGMGISRSLIVVRCKFAFPIDCSAGKHWELVSSPSMVTTYSKDLAMRLTACHAIAELLVKEHCAYHRKFINANHPNPRVYAVGNIVFARQAVRSDAQQEHVNKLQYAFTGPWKVISVLPGVSYELEHCKNASQKDKKHAADLSPYPSELIPFQPVDGAGMRYGQLYKPITAHPFKEAGLKGFTPRQSYQLAPSHLAQIQLGSDFHWPSLSELNEEKRPFSWSSDDEFRRYLADDSFARLLVMATGLPPSALHHVIPSIPAIHLLTASIICSIDHLFFVLHRVGSNDAHEWQLVRVAFEDLISLYPLCMQDGRFLFKFYICHPSDWHYNAINQRYWLQYHDLSDIQSPHPASETNLIRPSDSSASYATRHKLVPFCKWLNISHLDTFIHGPFEFASI
jgi:hypothetical protein